MAKKRKHSAGTVQSKIALPEPCDGADVARYIPTHVKEELRREVNFGCPVPKCGSPLLEWHHFDPPFEKEAHHRVEGMIALCQPHHKQADRGHFSMEQLRHYKQHPNESSYIRKEFDWFVSECVVRLGGTYVMGPLTIRAGGKEFLSLGKAEDGLQKISFLIATPDGKIPVCMNENFLTVAKDCVYDFYITVSSHKIKAWLLTKDVGFELNFVRVTLDELLERINHDQRRLSKHEPGGSPALDTVDSAMQTREFVVRATQSRLDQDGKIGLFDMAACKIDYGGFKLNIKRGLVGEASGGAKLILNGALIGVMNLNLLRSPTHQQNNPNASAADWKPSS